MNPLNIDADFFFKFIATDPTRENKELSYRWMQTNNFIHPLEYNVIKSISSNFNAQTQKEYNKLPDATSTFLAGRCADC